MSEGALIVLLDSSMTASPTRQKKKSLRFKTTVKLCVVVTREQEQYKQESPFFVKARFRNLVKLLHATRRDIGREEKEKDTQHSFVFTCEKICE